MPSTLPQEGVDMDPEFECELKPWICPCCRSVIAPRQIMCPFCNPSALRLDDPAHTCPMQHNGPVGLVGSN